MSLFGGKFFKTITKVAGVVTGTQSPVKTAIELSEEEFIKNIRDAIEVVKDLTALKINVTNKLSEDIYVLVTPNIDWQAAEVASTTIQIATGIGAIKVFKALTKLKKIESWIKFKDFLSLSSNVIQVKNTISTEIENAAKEVKDTVKKEGTKIDSKKSKVVYKENTVSLNPADYLNKDPYSPKEISRALGGYGKIFTSSEVVQFKHMSIIIMNSNLTKIITFHSNENWSWIVTEDGVVRQDPNNSSQENKGLGFFEWGHNDLDWSYVEMLTAATVTYDFKKVASIAEKLANKIKG